MTFRNFNVLIDLINVCSVYFFFAFSAESISFNFKFLAFMKTDACIVNDEPVIPTISHTQTIKRQKKNLLSNYNETGLQFNVFECSIQQSINSKNRNMLFTAYVLLRTELFKAYFCISLYLLFKLKCLLYAYEYIIAYCYGCHFMANTVYILYHQVADEWLIPVSITMTTVSNSTPTETSGTSAAEGPRLYFVPLVIVPLWILVGNSLVLLAVVRQRSLRTLSNSVIASLAFADFLLAVLVVPLGVYQLVSWQISSIEIHEFTSSDSIVSRDVCRVSKRRYSENISKWCLLSHESTSVDIKYTVWSSFERSRIQFLYMVCFYVVSLLLYCLFPCLYAVFRLA